jgi:lysophospholipase L1-like esterase
MREILLIPITLAATAILFGCGGADGSAAEPTASTEEATGSILVAALGDSITAGAPIWDPDTAIRAQIGTAADERSQYQYWAAAADSRLEFRNCGISGERTDQIAIRLGRCAAGADALIIGGGINDIAQGRPVNDIAADLRAMVEAGREMGLPVALTDVLPWNNGHPQADASIEGLNAAIERIGREEGVRILAFHDTLEDPDEPGVMKDEWTIDGNHPSIAGYRLLGEQAFELPSRP